jgi:hypothetical protein
LARRDDEDKAMPERIADDGSRSRERDDFCGSRSRERRCIATGKVRPVEGLVRFVVGPDNTIVPDIEGKLPGRGLWVTAGALEKARGAFAKTARKPVIVPADLVQRVEALLVARLKASLGLARRAGLLVQGFDNVLRSLEAKIPPRLLVEASDGAAEGRRKLQAAVGKLGLHVASIDCLSGAELSLALGRSNVIHAAVKPSLLAERLIVDSARLDGLRAVGKERNA